MKHFKVLTSTIIVIGLISSVLMASFNSGGGLFFVIIPYVIMLWFLDSHIAKKSPNASVIAYFLAATIGCIILALTLYEATSNPGSSSTSGLVFLMAPVFSIIIVGILYLVFNWLIQIIWYRDNYQALFKQGLIAIGVILAWGLLMLIASNFQPVKETKRDDVSFTKGDIWKAKKLGVFVKELHYCVEGFTGRVNFYPYIERAFRYVDDDSTKIELIEDKMSQFSVGFQRKAVDNGILETVNYHECAYMACLRKPQLTDTLIFSIKHSGNTVGTIKVWD